MVNSRVSQLLAGFLLPRPVRNVYSCSLARPSTNGPVCRIISTCGKNSSSQEIGLNHCSLVGSRELVTGLLEAPLQRLKGKGTPALNSLPSGLLAALRPFLGILSELPGLGISAAGSLIHL